MQRLPARGSWGGSVVEREGVESCELFPTTPPDTNRGLACAKRPGCVQVRKEVAEQVLSRTKLLQWLLSRLKAREFDSNKLEASELLSVLMQVRDLVVEFRR